MRTMDEARAILSSKVLILKHGGTLTETDFEELHDLWVEHMQQEPDERFSDDMVRPYASLPDELKVAARLAAVASLACLL